jgi:hypothetical protein
MIQIGHDMHKQSERDATTPRRKQRRKFRAKVAFNDGRNSLKQQKTRSVEAGFCPLICAAIRSIFARCPAHAPRQERHAEHSVRSKGTSCALRVASNAGARPRHWCSCPSAARPSLGPASRECSSGQPRRLAWVSMRIRICSDTVVALPSRTKGMIPVRFKDSLAIGRLRRQQSIPRRRRGVSKTSGASKAR